MTQHSLLSRRLRLSYGRWLCLPCGYWLMLVFSGNGDAVRDRSAALIIPLVKVYPAGSGEKKEKEETIMEQEMCVACHATQTEDSLCDDCFASLPMDTWVTVTQKEGKE